MDGIPFINILAIVHVCFVAAFIGALMAENWMEINVLFWLGYLRILEAIY